jgi:hypothetical protein
MRARATKAVLALAVAGAALAAAAAGGASAAAGPCAAGNLTGKVRQASGAAGTIALSIAFRNTSNAPCTLRGYPRLKLRNAVRQLPTRTYHGGLAILERPVRTVTLSPGKTASLLLAYSDVQVAGETRCPRSTELVLILGHGQGRLHVEARIGACNHGTLRISPFLAGLRNV